MQRLLALEADIGIVVFSQGFLQDTHHLGLALLNQQIDGLRAHTGVVVGQQNPGQGLPGLRVRGETARKPSIAFSRTPGLESCCRA